MLGMVLESLCLNMKDEFITQCKSSLEYETSVNFLMTRSIKELGEIRTKKI